MFTETDLLNTQTIDIDKAVQNKNAIWIDVRSSREYKKGNYTHSVNIELFNDIEYSKLGEVYKRNGKSESIKSGKKYIHNSLEQILEKISKFKKYTIYIYCARGGLRSKAFFKILEIHGYKSFVILGGYKSLRNYVLSSFLKTRNIIIIGGNTGSKKTSILKLMKKHNYNTVDLEKIANHRGSAFGDLGLMKQSTQQQFENDLSYEWVNFDNNSNVFVESESRTIGKIVIPSPIYSQMINSHYIRINMNFDRRIKNLISEYGKYPLTHIEHRLKKISRKLGSENFNYAVKLLKNNDLYSFCSHILINYYDKMYKHSLNKRKTDITTFNIENESLEDIMNLIIEKSNNI